MTSLINEQFLAEANLTAGYPGSEIELQPGDNEIKVLYIGTHAGGSQKSNRLLPDTKIEICNKWNPDGLELFYHQHIRVKAPLP